MLNESSYICLYGRELKDGGGLRHPGIQGAGRMEVAMSTRVVHQSSRGDWISRQKQGRKTDVYNMKKMKAGE